MKWISISNMSGCAMAYVGAQPTHFHRFARMTPGAAARMVSSCVGAYADFGVSVYCGLVAVWIAERDDGSYWDTDWRTARSPRAQRWLQQIAPPLFGDYDCLGHMSNGKGVYRKRAA